MSLISTQILTTLLAQLSVSLTKVNICSAWKPVPAPPEPSAEEIKNALIKHDIFKDLDIKNYPNYALQVNYEFYYMQLGNSIPDYLLITTPDGVNFTHSEPKSFYTMIMLGPDNPTRDKPKKRSYQHWVLGNIRGNQFLEAENLVPYEWRKAPYKKGTHRVIYLLYKQPGKKIMTFDERFMLRSGVALEREYFNMTFFSMKYDLGDPIAVNFIETTLEVDNGDGH